MKAHRTSRRSFRARSRIVPVVLAAAAGAAGGLVGVLALVAARASLVAGGHADASDRVALVTPLLCALAGGVLAVALLHRFKVADRDTLIGTVIAAAAPAFALGHLSRLFDPAGGGGFDPLSLTFWLGGFEWLEPARAADVVRSAPGLRPVSDAVGIEACAALAMCELVLVSGLLLAAVDLALSAPLCVGCRRWYRPQGGTVRRAATLPPATVIERASMRDWRFFRDLPPPRGRTALHLDLAACPACDRMSAVNITLSRPLRQHVTLVRDLRLGPDDLRTVRDLAAAAGRAHDDRSRPVPVFMPRG